MHAQNPRILIRSRSQSVDHPPLVVGPSLSNQRQDENFRLPNSAVPTNHVVSQNRPAIVAPPNTEVSTYVPKQIGEFRCIGRAELEVYAYTKTVEANSFKLFFKESENKCEILQTSLNEMRDLANKYNMLQTSFDEMKAIHAHTDRMHDDLKHHCNRFISDVQRDVFDDADGVRPVLPAAIGKPCRAITLSNELTRNDNNSNKRRRTARATGSRVSVYFPNKIQKFGRYFVIRVPSKTDRKRSISKSISRNRPSPQLHAPSTSNTLMPSDVPTTSSDPKPSDVPKTSDVSNAMKIIESGLKPMVMLQHIAPTVPEPKTNAPLPSTKTSNGLDVVPKSTVVQKEMAPAVAESKATSPSPIPKIIPKIVTVPDSRCTVVQKTTAPAVIESKTASSSLHPKSSNGSISNRITVHDQKSAVAQKVMAPAVAESKTNSSSPNPKSSNGSFAKAITASDPKIVVLKKSSTPTLNDPKSTSSPSPRSANASNGNATTASDPKSNMTFNPRTPQAARAHNTPSKLPTVSTSSTKSMTIPSKASTKHYTKRIHD